MSTNDTIRLTQDEVVQLNLAQKMATGGNAQVHVVCRAGRSQCEATTLPFASDVHIARANPDGSLDVKYLLVAAPPVMCRCGNEDIASIDVTTVDEPGFIRTCTECHLTSGQHRSQNASDIVWNDINTSWATAVLTCLRRWSAQSKPTPKQEFNWDKPIRQFLAQYGFEGLAREGCSCTSSELFKGCCRRDIGLFQCQPTSKPHTP